MRVGEEIIRRRHGVRAHVAKPGVWIIYVRLYDVFMGMWWDEQLCEMEDERRARSLARGLNSRNLKIPGVMELLNIEELLKLRRPPYQQN